MPLLRIILDIDQYFKSGEAKTAMLGKFPEISGDITFVAVTDILLRVMPMEEFEINAIY